jgi:hypothetical protein
MRKHIAPALYAAAAAAIALGTLGFAGAGSPARAAPQSLGPPAYDVAWTGYTAGGRWFRFVSTTLTVPPPTVNSVWSGDATIMLSRDTPGGLPQAQITVYGGGGPGSVTVGPYPGSGTTLNLSPDAGDQLALSIYYDRNGHDYFTVADLTQGLTRTVRATVGSVVYDKAWLAGIAGDSQVAQADTRPWQFTSSRVTTYTGAHGTIQGPWTTNELIATSTGTSTGRVVASPSGLWNGGANFGVWLRALPVTYTSGFAGYTDGVGPFRYVATTMTVPRAQAPAANGGTALVSLGHNGGPTPRPYANIEATPGGGAGSISYICNAAAGTFTVNPAPGDQVRASIFYDQGGHYSFTVTDATQGTTQTITTNALFADQQQLNSAQVLAMFDNSKVTTPPADTQVWQFTGSNVTTYDGARGSILGSWATSWWTDTTDGTHAGAVVADASVLTNGGQDFSVWLRHH